MKTSARDITEILNNDYIVCAGYCNLLSTLLNKLQIPNKIIECHVITKAGTVEPHNRVLVY